jgi:hypothetical protein
MDDVEAAQAVVLIDTSIWLDLCKDYRLLPVLDAVEHLLDGGRIRLVVPDLVVAEFGRNRDRVVNDAKKGFASHLKRVREAVVRFSSDPAARDATLGQINELDRIILMKDGAVSESVEKVEELLRKGVLIAPNEGAIVRAAQRGLDKTAPFHLAKNSTADAVIIEIYADCLANRAEAESIYFVTSNVRDFSEHSGDQRNPHPDLASLFGDRSIYLTSAIELVKHIDEELLSELEFERSYEQEPRGFSEIVEAEHLLFRQVWYNRHWNTRVAIEEGREKVVPEEQYSRSPYKPDEILDTVWAGALAAAKRTEEEVGLENLGPWDDFEWGMVNGKLSALRWVLGDEWDMLDT